MERIIFWLEFEATDYKKGVELYASIPKCNQNLLRNLQRTENVLNKQKLIYELKKYVSSYKQGYLEKIVEKLNTKPNRNEIWAIWGKPVPDIEHEAPTPVVESIKTEEKKTAPLFHQLPIELRLVLLEANNLFKENCLLKSELNDLADDDEGEAIDLMIKIDSNTKANALAWSKIDYWKEHKLLPKDMTISISDWSMDKLVYQRNLYESSLSRMRKRLNDNKELLLTAEGPAYNKLCNKIGKQEMSILEKEELLFNLKNEIDGKK